LQTLEAGEKVSLLGIAYNGRSSGVSSREY